MGVVISPSSELGKELRKWEQHPTRLALEDDGAGGERMNPGNPYQYRPYPRMLYKAITKPNGKVVCCEPPPSEFEFQTMDEYERALRQHDAITRSCQRIVGSESEERQAKNDGWRMSPPDALEFHDACQKAIAQAAAEAAAAARGMTAKARQELKQADTQTHEHVVDVKGRRKPGRPPKAVTGRGVVEDQA